MLWLVPARSMLGAKPVDERVGRSWLGEWGAVGCLWRSPTASTHTGRHFCGGGKGGSKGAGVKSWSYG